MAKRRSILAATLAVPALPHGSGAPSRPVTLVVGFPPGGQMDFAARVLQPVLQQSLGVSVTIDNRGCESGNIATKYVMRGRLDGYILLVGNNSPMVINPHTMDGMTVDRREMLAASNMLQSSPILCTHPSINVSNAAQLRACIAPASRVDQLRLL